MIIASLNATVVTTLPTALTTSIESTGKVLDEIRSRWPANIYMYSIKDANAILKRVRELQLGLGNIISDNVNKFPTAVVDTFLSLDAPMKDLRLYKDYAAKLNAAQKRGDTVISLPFLRADTIAMLRNVLYNFEAAAKMMADRPWWATVYTEYVQPYYKALYSGAKFVLSTVITLASNVVSTAGEAIETAAKAATAASSGIASIGKYLPFLVFGGLAVWGGAKLYGIAKLKKLASEKLSI